MIDFVNTVDRIGDEALTSSIIDRSITEILDNYVTSIGDYAFNGCKALTTVDFPAAKSIGTYAFKGCSALTTADFSAVKKIGESAFQSCSALTTANFPIATSIGTSAFQSCSALTTVNFSTVTKIGSYAFSGCWKLTTADFSAAKSIGTYVFRDCYALTTLILRSATMATLSNINALANTPIKKGTGYIYVPSALVDTYKAATNWTTYANQIRAIEDYPDICGG